MKLSIILPYDFYEDYLKDCLLSLEEQKLDDYEVLLVMDEGVSLDFLENYHLPIRILRTPEGSNSAVKRNKGLRHALGEYVYFIDCDDYIEKDSLSLLLSHENKDVVAGKRMVSWFKKTVYETMDDERNQEQNDKNKDRDRFENLEEIMEKNNDYKTNILIRIRHSLKNISCLHLLIRKELLLNHHILFNESYKYYGDLSFVVLLTYYAKTFDYEENAIYVKRRHNDPINAPAVSDIKDPENRFDEMVDAYKDARRLVNKDSYIHYCLDLKMVHYFRGFYARKVRRSEDDIWRTERFRVMGDLLRDMDPSMYTTGRYTKKLAKACMNNDLESAKKIIRNHLVGIKAKKTVKNKNEFNKFLYRHRYKKLPVEEDMIMFETFLGKSYADSPKYIYEYLAKNYPGQFTFVWVLNDKDKDLPCEGIKVKRFSKKYAYYLAVSKYFVFNTRQPLWFRKREEQVFLETWHGTPLKRLAFDQEEVTAASPTYKKQFYRQKQEWDYLIAPNKFSSDIFKSCFMYKEENETMLETGYPRNDLLSDPHRDEIALELKKKLGIPLDKKTILYAPTWRDDEYYGNGAYKFQLKLDLHLLKEKLSDEYVVLLRTHHYIADHLDVSGLEDFAFNLSKYDDITEVYLISDICITDYSSVFFDFANLKRPMLFYTYDLDKYRDVLRGFYISMEDELPGPLLFTSEEVVDSILNIDTISKKYADRYEKFYEKFCSWEDGHASQRVVEKVFFDK